jgi:hypothetical protein
MEKRAKLRRAGACLLLVVQVDSAVAVGVGS